MQISGYLPRSARIDDAVRGQKRSSGKLIVDGPFQGETIPLLDVVREEEVKFEFRK